MFGQNPKLAPEKGDGTILKVHSVFATIQGEGPYTGHPAVFIRLSGCNLACTFCDTEFDSYIETDVRALVENVKELSGGTMKLVVITGGEPFRQKIGILCNALLDNGFKVQIESNGTLYQEIPEPVEVVCSPKNTGSGYRAIREDVLKHTIALKFLISASQKDYSDIPVFIENQEDIAIYVQPMDEYDDYKNSVNQQLAMKVANEKNAIFSLQLHKILNIA